MIQNMRLLSVNISSGASSTIRNGVGNGYDPVNAIGYNSLDNYLYGTVYYALNLSSSLIRIGSNGDSQIILPALPFTLSGALGGFPGAGDVDEQGQYWVTVGGQSWVQIDLKPGSATYGKVRNTGVASLANFVTDWAWVPGGGDALYGFAYNPLAILALSRTYLMRFDRAQKSWTQVADYGNLVGANQWGAVYAGDDGFLYASEQSTGQIWRFPLNGTTPVRVATGPSGENNDGARCVRAR